MAGGATLALACHKLYRDITKSRQNLMLEKKKRKIGTSEGVLVRLPDDMIAQIDEVRRGEEDIPTRPEMIRRILQDWLEIKGKALPGED